MTVIVTDHARQFGVNRVTIERINDGRAHADVVLY